MTHPAQHDDGDLPAMTSLLSELQRDGVIDLGGPIEELAEDRLPARVSSAHIPRR